MRERIEIPIKISMKDSGNMHATFGSTQFVHTDDYADLHNKPRINNVELLGDKTSSQLKLQHQMDELTAADIDDILFGGM